MSLRLDLLYLTSTRIRDYHVWMCIDVVCDTADVHVGLKTLHVELKLLRLVSRCALSTENYNRLTS